jgi:hypothetical protein
MITTLVKAFNKEELAQGTAIRVTHNEKTFGAVVTEVEPFRLVVTFYNPKAGDFIGFLEIFIHEVENESIKIELPQFFV